MIIKYKGFRFPPHNHKLDVALILFVLLLLISCGNNGYWIYKTYTNAKPRIF